MLTNAARVREFHAAVGAPPPTAPALPSSQALKLRQTLISEEYQETQAALARISAMQERGETVNVADLAQLAHELADLLYVTYGGLADCGIDADAVFAEVHRANLQKARGPKRGDGKQLRPVDWTPADVASVLERQRSNVVRSSHRP
jgi:predicted HAD superfamily Cof-like phosphohydrolase